MSYSGNGIRLGDYLNLSATPAGYLNLFDSNYGGNLMSWQSTITYPAGSFVFNDFQGIYSTSFLSSILLGGAGADTDSVVHNSKRGYEFHMNTGDTLSANNSTFTIYRNLSSAPEDVAIQYDNATNLLTLPDVQMGSGRILTLDPSFPLQVSSGGTGATTTSQAKVNLGIPTTKSLLFTTVNNTTSYSIAHTLSAGLQFMLQVIEMTSGGTNFTILNPSLFTTLNYDGTNVNLTFASNPTGGRDIRILITVIP